MHIQELIQNMKKRPLMYIKEVRLDYIEHFLLGFSYSVLKKDENEIDKLFHGYFQKYVIKWIRDNIDADYQVDSLWYHTSIRDITEGESQAVELFFKLCEEFFDEYNEIGGDNEHPYA